jgi:hypothetical protein
MKKAKFIYENKEVEIGKFDPSSPSLILKKDWDEIQHEVFRQITNSGVFGPEELDQISQLSDNTTDTYTDKDFLKYIFEEDEKPGKYNRARAIYEYKVELESAIKGKRPTVVWAAGLDALRLGAVAEDYNY